MGKQKIYKILTVLLPAQWAFIQLAGNHPNLVETYYTNGLYSWISKIYRIILGWIPFSMGDLFYMGVILFICYQLISSIKNKTIFTRMSLFRVGAFLSLLYFFFNLNWGMNYLRSPLHKNLNISSANYTVDQLYELTEALILKTNSIQLSISKNDTVAVENPTPIKEFNEEAYKAYEILANNFPMFAYKFKATKSSIFSLPLTYMGFAGYLNPFTNESQVNYLLPKNSYAVTLCHEIAHQTGIASENEANFVGYLAATSSDNPYFSYSGYLMATRHCLFDLYRFDKEKFEQLRDRLHVGIQKDIQKNQEFWKKYQNWSEKYFKSAYDSYLKANKQKDGIHSYNKMVRLLVNYYDIYAFK